MLSTTSTPAMCVVCQSDENLLQCRTCKAGTICGVCLNAHIDASLASKVFFKAPETPEAPTPILCVCGPHDMCIPMEVAVCALKDRALKRYMCTIITNGHTILLEREERAKTDPAEMMRMSFLAVDHTYNALMCPRCEFGPIPIAGCASNTMHHGQVVRLDIVRTNGTIERGGGDYALDEAYKPVRINNACIACGHIEPSQSHMRAWDGRVHDVSGLQVKQVDFGTMFEAEYKDALQFGLKKKRMQEDIEKWRLSAGKDLLVKFDANVEEIKVQLVSEVRFTDSAALHALAVETAYRNVINVMRAIDPSNGTPTSSNAGTSKNALGLAPRAKRTRSEAHSDGEDEERNPRRLW